jgi:hypothetical protein
MFKKLYEDASVRDAPNPYISYTEGKRRREEVKKWGREKEGAKGMSKGKRKKGKEKGSGVTWYSCEFIVTMRLLLEVPETGERSGN